MAIAFDAVTYSSANPSFSHTAAVGVRGVIVAIQAVDATPTAVTYDGDSLSQIANSPATVSIGGTGNHSSIWFLGSGVSSGANTVSITGPTSGNCVAHAYTVTGSADTEVVDSDNVASLAAGVDPSVTLTLASRSCFIINIGATGVGTVGGFDPINAGSWTIDQELDVGASSLFAYRHTSIVTADTECGLDQPNDNARFVAAAFAEVAGVAATPKGVFGLPLHGPFGGPVG